MFDAVNVPVYTDNMTDKPTPDEIRLRWLTIGCDTPALAAELGVTRQAAHAMIQRATARRPLYWGEGSPEEQRAMQRAARLLLEARGIRWRSPRAD